MVPSEMKFSDYPLWMRWCAGAGLVLMVALNLVLDYYHPTGFLIDAFVVVYLILRRTKLAC